MPGSEFAPANATWRSRCIGVLLGAALALAPAAALRAETASPATPAAIDAPEQVWTAEALDKLAARIALYPDALIAQILPAATFPLQVVEAARWLAAKKSVAEGDKQEWDASVKALLRYPTVLRMMSDDLRWTDELGQAFIAQPEDVLKAIQRLRRVARALGNLKPTPRQRVIVDPDSTIVIAPPEAEPDIVYLPIYDPDVVFFEPAPPTGLWITFDVGVPLGIWIGTGVSWASWHVVHGGWGYDWGWGNVYGGCCRGSVYTYTPTVINRRLTIGNRHVWRPRHTGERRRPPQFRGMPSFRAPSPARPTPGDISRGRLPPRTATPPAARRDMPRISRPPDIGRIRPAPTTERNAQRGRESLRRATPPPRTPPRTAVPPVRATPPAARIPERYRATPRTPSPGFTPRTRPDTQRFQTRGRESRTTVPRAPAPRIHTPAPAPRVRPPSPAQRTAPPARREPPKTAPPARAPGTAPSPQPGVQRRHR